MVKTEDINDMANKISNGAVKVPAGYNEEYRIQWNRLLRQINEIKEKGGIVDIPFEIAG